MTNDDVARAVRHFKAMAMPAGVECQAYKVRIADGLAVQVDLFAGGLRSEPFILACEYESSFGRLVLESAKRLADAACGGSGVPPLSPMDASGDDDHYPRWLVRATVEIAKSAPGRSVAAPRHLAIVTLGDIEADDLPVPAVSVISGSVVLKWSFGTKAVAVAFRPDGLTYTVTPMGFGPDAKAFDVKASVVKDRRGNDVFCSRPELLRVWLGKLFETSDDHQFGWAPGFAFADAGWWTAAEIDALTYEPGGDDIENERWTA